MVKNIFSNLSRGFFYTIGKVIAFIFIAFIISTILCKINPDLLPNLMMKDVYAAEINAQFDGHAVFFLNDSPYPDGANTGYNSSYTQDQVPIPDASRFPINIPGYFNAYGSGTFYPVKQIGIVNDNFTFRGGVRYEFRFDFKWVYNNNDYINDTTRSYTLWNTHSDDSVRCDNGNTPCSVKWEHVTTGYYAPYYTAVVTYVPQNNKTGVVVDLGSVNNENQAVFINYAPEASHLAISRSSINGYIDSTGDDIINSGNDNTDKIIENDNKNQQQTNDRLDSIGDKIIDESMPTEDPFDINIGTNTPISDLITLPLTLLNAYLIGFNGTCQRYSFGTLYGTELYLPCIDLENILGSTIWRIIDNLCSLFLIYEIAMLCVYIFESITSLKDPMLSLYSPKHAYHYHAKHGGDD